MFILDVFSNFDGSMTIYIYIYSGFEEDPGMLCVAQY